MKKTVFIITISFLLSIQTVSGQIPQLISYSAVATEADGTPLPEGGHTMIFSLYEQATGGQAVWTEEYVAQNPVQVGGGGAFNVILGSVEPLNIVFDKPYFLGIAIDGGSEGTPRVQLTSAPYSLGSSLALSVADGAVTSNKIPAGQVVKSILIENQSLMDDITIAAGDNISISRNENTLTISASGGSGGDITAVKTEANSGLLGGGTSGDISLKLDTNFTDKKYVNEGQSKSITSDMLTDAFLTPSSLVVSDEFETWGGKENPNSKINLMPFGRNICFLTRVALEDIDATHEIAECKVFVENGMWKMDALGPDDSNAFCKARCLSW